VVAFRPGASATPDGARCGLAVTIVHNAPPIG